MKVVLIHKGRQEYVRFVLKQLQKYHADIVLLTDDVIASKEYFGENISYESLDNYDSLAGKFQKIYQHLSHNSYEFEFFCMARWLVLYEFLHKNNISDCWHIDSDVLVWTNLEQYTTRYLKDKDFCYVGSCGHIFYGTQYGLRQFSDFLFRAYSDQAYIKIFQEYFEGKRSDTIYRNNGASYEDKSQSVTDMTLFHLFVRDQEAYQIQTHDLGIIFENQVFDNNIGFAEGFQTLFGLKRLVIDDGKLYGYCNMRKILFHALHFQGNTKKYISFFANSSTLSIAFYVSIIPHYIRSSFVLLASYVLKRIGLYKRVRYWYLNFYVWKKK